MLPFCRFSASFSLRYDITDVILQNNEKMKLNYLSSLLFDLSETLIAVKPMKNNHQYPFIMAVGNLIILTHHAPELKI